MISIHAPRTGSDVSHCLHLHCSGISIHAPRTGSDGNRRKTAPSPDDFNPRSPHGERRKGGVPQALEAVHFNPRSPHGERPQRCLRANRLLLISIHAPRTGSDLKKSGAEFDYSNFNPRSPHGERRTGFYRPQCSTDFNPRSPHGERH